jgi:multicomponent Na+:H+ antiporter subunit C
MTFSISIGVMFGIGLYLILSNSLLRLVLGIGLMSQGANLLVFSSGGLTRNSVPIIYEGQVLTKSSADPLSQALVLTAIVIGFALTAFLIVLVKKAYDLNQTENPDEMRSSDQ